jgi:3-hydroxyisobutyrate dehydrogenase-like beta-hydroxyacid dehydrogenase
MPTSIHERSPKMNIAFLGMGIMGSSMAKNCLKAGHDLTVFNRTASKCEPLARLGARVASTAAEAAKDKEAVLICISDTPDVEQVIFGEDGIVVGLGKGSTANLDEPILVVDHSTISSTRTEQFAQRLAAEAPAMLLDAPVSGGDKGAREGTLSIMCGGSGRAFEKARPLLEAMGKNIVHVGTRSGDGQRTKMINQLLCAVNCVATTEAMRLGEYLGVDMQKVLQAVTQGAGGSWSLSNLGPRFLERDFDPGFRLRHLMKDVEICLEAINGPDRSGGKPDFPGLKLAQSMIVQSVQAGHGDDNIHGMARIYPD